MSDYDQDRSSPGPEAGGCLVLLLLLGGLGAAAVGALSEQAPGGGQEEAAHLGPGSGTATGRGPELSDPRSGPRSW